MEMIAKGAACFRCRKRKRRCDGLKPICFRCRECREECVYPTGIARRQTQMDVLEARALELERRIHKLILGSAHDLPLVSAKLLARIKGLKDVVDQKQTQAQTHPAAFLDEYHLPSQKVLVNHQLNSYEWLGFGDLPAATSHHLLDLLLPHWPHFCFFVDLSRFLECAHLPPPHPESIHPCLLNACYLAACSRSEGELASLEPYFLRRTRHFLDQALMFADRITHFLWASVILGCYFAMKRRLEECFSVTGAATHLAFACGLSAPQGPEADGTDGRDQTAHLLSLPKDEAETLDRIRLAHAIFLMDHLVPVLGGPPSSFPFDPRWTMTPKEASLKYQYDGELTVGEIQMSELWRSEVHFKVLLTRTTERTIGFAQYSYEGSSQGIDDEYSKLEAQINSQHTMIAPLSDMVKLRSQGPTSTFNGLVLAAHIAMYTNGILLHAVRAGKDSEARIGMLKCVDAVLSVCKTIREYRRFQKVEYGLVVAAYMLIVIRGVARELQHSEARRNTGASTNHCYAIHLFLDVIEDITSSSPAWADTPLLLNDTLMAAVNSIMVPTTP